MGSTNNLSSFLVLPHLSSASGRSFWEKWWKSVPVFFPHKMSTWEAQSTVTLLWTAWQTFYKDLSSVNISGLWAVVKRSVIHQIAKGSPGLKMSSWVFLLEKTGEEERKSDLVLQVNLWSSPKGKKHSVTISQHCSWIHRSPLSSKCTACCCASVSSLLQHHHSEHLILYFFSVSKVIICAFKCSVIISWMLCQSQHPLVGGKEYDIWAFLWDISVTRLSCAWHHSATLGWWRSGYAWWSFLPFCIILCHAFSAPPPGIMPMLE